MRTFAVLALFLCSLLGLGATLSAEANSTVRIEPAFYAPEEMDGTIAREKKHKDGGRDDEESEEDFAPAVDAQRAALELLDPSDFDRAVKLQIAAARAN